MLLIAAAVIGCAPSNDEACKAAAAGFTRCAKGDEIQWGDKQIDTCKKNLDTLGAKDKDRAKSSAKAIKKCSQMEDCESAKMCLMVLLVDDAKSARDDRCAGGDADACMELAGKFLKGEDGAAKDDKKAAELMQKACDLGKASGCEFYGKMLRDGRGVAKDEAKALQLLTKACDSGAPGACTSVGLAAMKNSDNATGVAKLTKACDGQDGLGCAALGALYLHGNGVEKNEAKAKELFKKACSLKEQMACDKLKELGN